MMTKKSSITAGELMAKLAKDPEYQAMKAEKERLRLEKAAKLGIAEAPLVEVLKATGVQINNSVWDLVNTHERYDVALPVLADHLERDYPSEILAGIARAMAVPESMQWRPRFIRLFRQQPRLPEMFRDGLAVAIGNTTGPQNVWETMELLRDPSLGQNRALMLPNLSKAKEPEVRQALLELRLADPMLAKAISQLSWVRKLDRESKK